LPAVLNAANEVAVEAFLAKQLPFLEIAGTVQAVMAMHAIEADPDLSAIMAADGWARQQAQLRIAELNQPKQKNTAEPFSAQR